MTSAERIVDRSTRARDSVDAATPPPPGASTARTLAVGTTGGRSLLGRQRLVHDLLGSCRSFGHAADSGRGQGSGSPDVSQALVVSFSGAPVGATGVVRHGPQLVEGATEGGANPGSGDRPP